MHQVDAHHLLFDDLFFQFYVYVAHRYNPESVMLKTLFSHKSERLPVMQAYQRIENFLLSPQNIKFQYRILISNAFVLIFYPHPRYC